MAPLPEFIGQRLLLGAEREGLQILQTLMHQIEGVVDELGGLVGCSEGNAGQPALTQQPVGLVGVPLLTAPAPGQGGAHAAHQQQQGE